ncbi:MAG: hypothetical protein IT445_21070 [Phycisphaeraceae bacterium]|nr:hypothetical protein [Phycisphaeraceae bacterium]
MIAPNPLNLDPIAERNRRNAGFSTGPRTPAGKAVARRNALKHGLCANPAAAVIENRKKFDQLHNELIDRIQPQNLIEAALVHRIAVSLWRLQRAAKVDAAASNVAVRQQPTGQERVQVWMDRILEGFSQVNYKEVKDISKVPQALRHTAMQRGEVWHRLERTFLSWADWQRENEMMADGAALAAMAYLLKDLTQILEDRQHLGPIDAQLLAWLLGESAERLLPREHEIKTTAMFYPDEREWASPIDILIGQARKRPQDASLSDELQALIEVRLSLWRSQSRVAANPYLDDQMEDLKTASLLPEAATLDRLIRYETHADRTLLRSLEALAMLRGLTLSSIRATVTGRSTSPAIVDFQQQPSLWDARQLQ